MRCHIRKPITRIHVQYLIFSALFTRWVLATQKWFEVVQLSHRKFKKISNFLTRTLSRSRARVTSTSRVCRMTRAWCLNSRLRLMLPHLKTGWTSHCCFHFTFYWLSFELPYSHLFTTLYPAEFLFISFFFFSTDFFLFLNAVIDQYNKFWKWGKWIL